MIQVEALPAREGDCLWVEWTHGAQRRRMLIDGGSGSRRTTPPALAARIEAAQPGQCHFDCVVCTHIDCDHIDGLLGLLTQPPPRFSFDEVWFNGRRHLRSDVLGPDQGDLLSELLERQGIAWNARFGGEAIVVPDGDALPVVSLPGLRLTLLGPTWPALDQLARKWPTVAAMKPITPADADVLGERDRHVPLEELAHADYVPDPSEANGSSIALLAEDDEGSRVLFGADAPAEALVSSLRRIQPAGRIRIDLCKVPHHGSSHNVSPELLAVLDCRHWLLSTNGAKFRHPDRRAIARILAAGGKPVLWFNYLSESNREFAAPKLAERFGFEAVYPGTEENGIAVRVMPGAVLPGTGERL